MAAGVEPAVQGEDFEIVDAEGVVLQPNAKDQYEIVFPQAKKAKTNIYVKLLNNTAASGQRAINISIVDNIQEQFRVDNFSTARRRTIQIN